MHKNMKIVEVDDKTKQIFGAVHTAATLGGDPEFFVADKTGMILNSDKFFPGKHEPIKIAAELEDDPDTAKIVNKLYFDGIQAEIAPAFNICRETLIRQIARLLTKAKWIIGPDHDIVLKPAVRVKKSVIAQADPEARIFGCMPDYNAYTVSVNTPPMDAADHPYRYAGGHIHLGQSSPYLKKGNMEYEMVQEQENHLKIIKLLDLLVSIPTLPLDNAPGSKYRRDKYGKAGCFRPTPYGVEYRTQSCWWLQSPITTSLVFGMARIAWSLIAHQKDKEFLNYVGVDEQEIRGTIDESDVKNAMKVWKKMRPYIAWTGTLGANPLNIRSATGKTSGIMDAFRSDPFDLKTMDMPLVTGLGLFEYMLKNGIRSVVKSDNTIESWGLPTEDKGDFIFLASEPKYTGFVRGGFAELSTNKDFHDFQKSFWKECVAA